MSDDPVMQALLAIKTDIGTLNGTMEAHVRAFQVHVEQDRLMAEQITGLRLHNAQAAGAGSAKARMWSILAVPLGGLGASLAHFVFKKFEA